MERVGAGGSGEQEVTMRRFEDRMVYGLERNGRTVHCSSFAMVSVLLAMGWMLSDSGHWAELVRERAAGSPPSSANRPRRLPRQARGAPQLR